MSGDDNVFYLVPRDIVDSMRSQILTEAADNPRTDYVRLANKDVRCAILRDDANGESARERAAKASSKLGEYLMA